MDGQSGFTPIYHHGDLVIPSISPVEPLHAECQDFIESIMSGRQARSNGQSGLRIVAALEAASRWRISGGSSGSGLRPDSHPGSRWPFHTSSRRTAMQRAHEHGLGTTPSIEVQECIKRQIDLVVSATALLLLSPFLVLIGLFIRLDAPGRRSSGRNA